MAPDPSPRAPVGQQVRTFLVFLVKLAGMLAALSAFGYVIYLLRRSLG
jgi:hypothetical protein